MEAPITRTDGLMFVILLIGCIFSLAPALQSI